MTTIKTHLHKHFKTHKELGKKALNHVKKQPDFVKQQIALWVALSITLIVFAIWVTTFNFNNVKEGFLTTADGVKQISQPFEAVKSDLQQFSNDLTDLKEGLAGF